MTITQIAGTDDATAHVIFLHGLNGSLATWLAGRAEITLKASSPTSTRYSANVPEYWPTWLADDVPGLAVWAASFPAPVITRRGRGMHYSDRAANLLPQILAEPKLQRGTIALVGYSFGGIVAKAILRTAEGSRSDPKAGSFFERASRIALIATPNAGAPAAKLTDYFKLVVSPSAATMGLVARDPNLRDLHIWFRNWADGRTDSVRVFTESLPLPLIGMVVPPESGDGGVGRPIPIDADHLTIVRVNARSNELYRILADFLQDLPYIEQARIPLAPRLDAESPRNPAIIADVPVVEAKDPELIGLYAGGAHCSPGVSQRPVEIIDEALSEALDELLIGRFLHEFPTQAKATQLYERLIAGDLSSATHGLRGRALAWCARVLSHVDGELEAATLALRAAAQLASVPEVSIAQAFVLAAHGEISTAIAALSELGIPAGRSAALAIEARHATPTDALQWVETAAIAPTELDEEGKQFLLSLLITMKKWKEAAQIADDLAKDEASLAPQSLWLSGLVLLSMTAPVELREAALSQVSFHPRTFPLSSDGEAIAARQRAEMLLMRFARRARDLNCPRQAEQAEDLALWVRLREAARTGDARAELQASMADPATAIRRLGMALDFGLDVDIAAVEMVLDRREAIVGGKSLATAAARFTLALAKPSREAAAYLGAHREQLLEFLNPNAVLVMEAQLLVASDQRDQATALLREFQERLSPQEFEQISATVASAGATNDIAEATRAYERDDSLTALFALVDSLATAKEWGSLAPYADKLFQATGDMHAFEMLVGALEHQALYEREYELLSEHPDLWSQSEDLKAVWAWALFRAGRLSESATILGDVRTKRDDENDRALFVNLAIASGRWEALGAFVETEYQARSSRSPGELLRTANLAVAIKSSRGLDLARAAVASEGDNAHVLVAAYGVATATATEETQEAANWFQLAASLSTDDGPIKSASLEELISRAPDWQRGQDEVARKLEEGELPLFLAARLMRRTTTQMVVLQGVANLRERDSTARPLIPIRRGIDRPSLNELKIIAVESTALLVLALSDQLEAVVDAVDRVVVPHGTLSQLFEDGQKLPYHQPSLVKQAQMIRDALSTGALHRFVATAAPNDALGREVGSELAALLVEAKAHDDHEPTPYVVHPPPIFKSASLLRELADLGIYSARVASCSQVLTSLEAVGALTNEESDRARRFLRLQEPDEAASSALPTGTPLYLDSLSLGYLYHAGLLDKLHTAGFPVSVSAEALANEDRLLNYSKLAEEVADVVERVRRVLGAGIETGKVVVANAFRAPTEGDAPTDYPTTDIFRLARDVDVIVCDDRSLGRYQNVDDGGRLVPVASSFDLVAALTERGAMTIQVLQGMRHRLRAANLCFVPLSTEELDHHLSRTRLDSEGNLVETAEVRAIRENLLSIRASDLLQLPAEGSWLIGAMEAIRSAMRAQWRDGVEPELAARRAQWLLGLCDLRGWAHRLLINSDDAEIDFIYAQSIAPLLLPLTGVSKDLVSLYWSWISDVLETMEFSNQGAVLRLVRVAEDVVVNAPMAPGSVP